MRGLGADRHTRGTMVYRGGDRIGHDEMSRYERSLRRCARRNGVSPSRLREFVDQACWFFDDQGERVRWVVFSVVREREVRKMLVGEAMHILRGGG